MNPFHHGNPLKSPNFLGRKKELRRTSQRICSSQSTAIVGEPRTDKTSVLLYLAAQENHAQLYSGETERQRIFSFLDAHTFDEQMNQAEFWVLAFAPLFSAVIQPSPESKLASFYANCLNNSFNNHSLALMLDQLAELNYHLVLLVDEFGELLNRPQLCRSEFLGSLRSLASIKSALSLVIASRQSVSVLNNLTQQLNNTGSPYFNIFEEYSLMPFSDHEVLSLLSRANGRFTDEDIDFMVHAAGYQPYLLQAIAAALWDIYEDGDTDNPNERQQRAAQVLYGVATGTLKSTWAAWSPQMRMAITVVALAQTPRLLEKRLFNNNMLLRDMRDFGPELRALERQGYVSQQDNNNWRILPAAIQWWLTDELVRTVRSEKDFAQWIQAQEWDGLLTKKEEQQLIHAGKSLADLLKGGIPDLIKFFVGGS